jgi:hypothetical protein
MGKDDRHPGNGARDAPGGSEGREDTPEADVGGESRQGAATELDLNLPLRIARLRAAEEGRGVQGAAGATQSSNAVNDDAPTEMDLGVRQMSQVGRVEAARPTVVVDRPRVRASDRGVTVLVIVAMAVTLSVIAVAIVYVLGGAI